VRYALSGGALVPAGLARQVEAAFGVPLVITFAQTESSCSITMTRAGDPADDRAQTVGRPLPQTEVKITDLGTGRTVPWGAIGEICTRGYLVMPEYLGDPQATAAAIDDDGWLRTGELGSMDERGYIRIEGRRREMIIRGGENIYSREIEAVLLSHPGAAEAAVVGMPDRFWGEEVGAVIRWTGPPPPAAAERELAGLCCARLAAYKVPARWRFTDRFPLTATGKIRKAVLSAQQPLSALSRYKSVSGYLLNRIARHFMVGGCGTSPTGPGLITTTSPTGCCPPWRAEAASASSRLPLRRGSTSSCRTSGRAWASTIRPRTGFPATGCGPR